MQEDTKVGAPSQGDPNTQGILVEEILKRCELHVVSQSEIVVRPLYTYLSGESLTIVDYILLDAEAAASDPR